MNALVQALETSQQHRFTLDDVLRMQKAGILDESARVELIEGVLVEMASEGASHVRLKTRIAYALMAKGVGSHIVVTDSTLRLSPVNAPSPDLHIYEASLPLTDVSGQNVGLVIEVAYSTIGSDLTFKADLYAQHGVREYWVVDVNTDTVITHRTLAGGTYRDVVHHSARDTVTAQHLPGITLCLAELPTIR